MLRLVQLYHLSVSINSDAAGRCQRCRKRQGERRRSKNCGGASVVVCGCVLAPIQSFPYRKWDKMGKCKMDEF